MKGEIDNNAIIVGDFIPHFFFLNVYLQYVGPCAEAWPRGATQCLRSGSSARRSYPTPEVRGGARRSYPMPEVRGSSGEEQLHVQGAVAARAQEGREELLHVQGQKGRL